MRLLDLPQQSAVLLGVEQIGVACHTGRRSCFFFELRDGLVTRVTNYYNLEDWLAQVR